MKKLLFTAVAMLGLAAETHAQVPNYVPANGLVGWWPFNGNANDESGNGNDGTVNGATLSSDRFGNGDKSFIYDGLNDWIVVSNPQNLPTGNSNRTFSCWFNYQTIIQATIYNYWNSLI